MASEALLPVLSEIIRIIEQDLVVQRLRSKGFLCCGSGQTGGSFGPCLSRTIRVQCDGRHGVHIRLCDVFDHDRNVEVPGSDRFVIGRRHKPSVLVHKGDGIDRSQMLIIFLRDFPRVYIILLKLAGLLCIVKLSPHLDDFLVHHAGQENVLLVVVWMESEDMGHFPIGEVFQALACFCVP